jgi:hypothetical protein
MAFINGHVRSHLLDAGCRIFFVSGAVTKWYNAKRTDKKTEVCLLGGWYWTLGREEHGPFRTPSAAERDVYYRKVLKVKPPVLDENDVKEAQRQIQIMIQKAQEKARRGKRKAIPMAA